MSVLDLAGVSAWRGEERECLVSVCHYGAHVGGFPLVDDGKKDEGDEDYDCMHNEKKNFDGNCCGIGDCKAHLLLCYLTVPTQRMARF